MAKRILWICFHHTHRYEEVNLLLDAGHEVIPIVDPPNEVQGLAWKRNNTLPPDVLHSLRKIDLSVNFESMRFNRRPNASDKALINKHIDYILLASFIPEVPDLLKWFKGKIIFRAFGHGDINSYTAICRSFKINLDVFNNDRYIWCPIANSLDKAENPKLIKNRLTIVPAVSRRRLTPWKREKSHRVVCNTISRIQTVGYYQQVYNSYIKKYGNLPLMILGKNKKNSKDQRIVGNLEHRAYYEKMSTARVMLYHTNNPYHLHYHPIEALAMGIPTLYHSNSMLAHYAREAGIEPPGVYNNPQHAVELAKKCLNDIDFAVALSERQKVFPDKLISKDRAVEAMKTL